MIKYLYKTALLFLFIQPSIAQGTIDKNCPLFGLKKAGFQDIDFGQPIMLDGITIPVYTETQKQVQGEDFMNLMMTNDFIPEPYINDKKEIKAFVLRKATEQEKEQMMNMQTKKGQESELLGKEAKPFFLKDIYGKKYSLKDLKGKVVVINFWFVECKPCVMEIPELNKIVEKYKDKNVVFLGLATNEKPKIKDFLKKQKFNYNIIAESKEMVDSYKINAFPTHLIIDANSIIRYQASGLGPTTTKEIEAMIEQLIE